MKIFGREFTLFGKPQKLEEERYKPENHLLPYVEKQQYLYKVDVRNWRMSHQNAIDIYRPRYERLIDVYEDAILDATLSAKLQTRTANITNTPFQVLNANNEINPELTGILKQSWFEQVQEYIIESKYFGHSLLEFVFDKQGQIYKVEIFPRKNVIPQWNAVIPDLYGEQYIYIDQEPYVNNYILVKLKPKDLGLLLPIARYTIFKKNATNNWSQFQELFGMPYRFADYQGNDKKVIDNLMDMLEHMGSAGYGAFPKGTELKFLESSKSDPFKVFQEAINTANSEISNRVLGFVQTDNSEGSYAREKVNYDVSNDITTTDLRFVESIVNDKVLPLLNKWSYNFEGHRFAFDRTWKLPLATNQLDIDKWLLENFDISEEYIEQTYGVPVQKKKTEPNKIIPAQAKWLDNVENCCSQHSYFAQLSTNPVAVLDAVIEDILRQIFEGIIKDEQTDIQLAEFTASEFWQAVRSELNGSYDFGASEADWLSLQQHSLYSFSMAKSFAQMKEMQNLVFDKKGKKRRFTEFRADALAVHKRYNELWLETEYNAVVRGSVMGKKWLDIDRDKDLFPFLEYRTANDNKVRTSHRELNGKVLPVDSPFWDKYYPANGWNCRCTVKQLQETNNITDLDKANKLGKSATDGTYWRKNVGKSEIFTASGTDYFKSLPKSKDKLEAEKHYRLPSVNQIYNKGSKVLDNPTTVSNIEEYVEHLGKQVYDKNGLAIEVNAKAIKSSDFARALENINVAEVWEVKAGERIYLLFYESKPVLISVKKNKLTVLDSISKSEVNKLRKGILIQS